MIHRDNLYKIVRFAAVTAVLLTIVWYLHRRSQKDEPVWDANAVEWGKTQVPLDVCPDGTDELQTGSARHAVKQFNTWVGFQLFRWNVTGIPACDILIQSGSIEVNDARTQHALASSWVTKGEVQTGHVVLHRPGDSRIIMFAVEHELGHLVGLAHDDFSRSIMYLTVTDGWSDVDGTTSGSLPPKVTDKDAAALRSRYY